MLLFHAKLFRGGEACFEHSNLLKVTPSTPGPPAAKPGEPVPDTRVGRGRCSLTGWGRTPPRAVDRAGPPEIQLRAFQLQQLKYTLLELELPRLLAPDLPSN